jgi:hypothetical protein
MSKAFWNQAESRRRFLHTGITVKDAVEEAGDAGYFGVEVFVRAKSVTAAGPNDQTWSPQ